MTLSGNGASQSVTRKATNVAGNVGSATVSGIKIDNENPTITDVNVAKGFYTLGAVPTATCTATDSFSHPVLQGHSHRKRRWDVQLDCHRH